MKTKVYDSKETLEAGLKAEQATIVEYTGYLNLAKQNANEGEVKLWEHIIKDEEEHVIEFKNALNGNFNLLDSEKTEGFEDDINDVLVDSGIDHHKFKISEEDPYYYIDFGSNLKDCENAYKALRSSFYKCDFVDADGFFYIRVVRR